MPARIAIFGPHPLLTVSLEREGSERQRIHFHAGGQGVWVARVAGALGAEPVLCGFVGGEGGALLRPLLEQLPGERRLLAAYVRGPVSEPAQLRAAAERLREAGAGSVIVTRGEQPALVLHDGRAWLLVPPRFERGYREGGGDAMMGALAAAWAQGASFEDAAVIGAAAGAATFLRQGLGSAEREVVEELAGAVRVEPFEG